MEAKEWYLLDVVVVVEAKRRKLAVGCGGGASSHSILWLAEQRCDRLYLRACKSSSEMQESQEIT